MFSVLIAYLLPLARAQLDEDSPSADTSHKTAIEQSVEYAALCRTCPYSICTHVYESTQRHNLTCWTQGDVIGDTDMWLRTTDGCYLAEYDLIEYEGDFSAELDYCGNIPLAVTQERATVRYLSECLWGYETGNEGIAYYGRDVDITVTCWAEGSEVIGDLYWYKTLDYCWVSGAGLWDKPGMYTPESVSRFAFHVPAHDSFFLPDVDRETLEWCGPPVSPRQNLTVEPLHTDGAKPTPLPPDEDEAEDEGGRGDLNLGLSRRWLSPGQVSEEDVGCYTCARWAGNETCDLVTTYKFNQTAVIQCAATWDAITIFTYTTDWCWMNGSQFWTEPWHHYNYPACSRFNVSGNMWRWS
ncbi:uncharacterized protein DNG_09724 [Cephalotrichum gorgonifer]|uniref:Uncharacterized protein n=1 Tax=Cephalotrichum gorgonifer TaxID=2041049 RepID=A0AAE8N8R8_9PEZI|nr:uncharacterized protein DNG_09724 [Cephalotrichum gorgonifer]